VRKLKIKNIFQSKEVTKDFVGKVRKAREFASSEIFQKFGSELKNIFIISSYFAHSKTLF